MLANDEQLTQWARESIATAQGRTARATTSGGHVDQCKAKTGRGARCVSKVKAPSRSLCGSHVNALARGSDVVNFENGRRFPKPRS